MQERVRTAKQLKPVREVDFDTVSLVLGMSVHKVIRSKRAIVASKAQLAALRRNDPKNPIIG